jgi:hypothetical protein
LEGSGESGPAGEREAGGGRGQAEAETALTRVVVQRGLVCGGSERDEGR